jgi:hypothetical protein
MESVRYKTREEWERATEEKRRKNPNLGEQQVNLREMVHWPTARAEDSECSGAPRDWKASGPTQGSRKSPNLGTQAHISGQRPQDSPNGNGKSRGWPTARAQDAGDSPNLTPEAHEERQARKKAANPNLNELHKPLAGIRT